MSGLEKNLKAEIRIDVERLAKLLENLSEEYQDRLLSVFNVSNIGEIYEIARKPALGKWEKDVKSLGEKKGNMPFEIEQNRDDKIKILTSTILKNAESSISILTDKFDSNRFDPEFFNNPIINGCKIIIKHTKDLDGDDPLVDSILKSSSLFPGQILLEKIENKSKYSFCIVVDDRGYLAGPIEKNDNRLQACFNCPETAHVVNGHIHQA